MIEYLKFWLAKEVGVPIIVVASIVAAFFLTFVGIYVYATARFWLRKLRRALHD